MYTCNMWQLICIIMLLAHTPVTNQQTAPTSQQTALTMRSSNKLNIKQIHQTAQRQRWQAGFQPTPTSRVFRCSPAGAAERMQEEAQSAQILSGYPTTLDILRRVKSSVRWPAPETYDLGCTRVLFVVLTLRQAVFVGRKAPLTLHCSL